MRHKLIIICSLLFLSVFTKAQTQPLFFKPDYPRFTPVNKDFDISLTSRIAEGRYDGVDFYILTGDEVEIKEIIFKNFLTEKKLRFRESLFPGTDEKSYKIKIPLEDPLFRFGDPFQILVAFGGYSGDRTELNFAAEIRKTRNGKIFYSSLFPADEQNALRKAEVKFYRPFRTAGSALNLSPNSSVTFTFEKERSYNNLLVEFWGKFNGTSTEFFNVLDLNSGDTLISLLNTPFRMIYAKESGELKYYSSNFASRNSWIHFSVVFSKQSRSADVYADDIKLFSIPFRSQTKLSDCVFSFVNQSANGQISFDLLKIWDFRNALELSFRNKNYLNYSADSSSLFLKCDFDNPAQFEQSNRNQYNIKISGGTLRESDAPVFPRAPDLSVMRYSNFYSIEWKGRDVANVRDYTLEKSTDGKKFDQIYFTDADASPEKVYYHSDERNDENEIVIYRLKQVNNDGSVIYSPQIKIGQGQKKTFSVDQNYPNPFNPVTSITVNIIESGEIEIRVYDLVGKQIALLYSGPLSEGLHSYQFDGTELPSGIYFYEVKSPKFLEVRKMILAK